MMTENTRYQTAKACAGETIEALYSIYWADSFDAALLESRLVETVSFYTRDARRLSEPHPNPDSLKELGCEAMLS
jgi:hypothetical protein